MKTNTSNPILIGDIHLGKKFPYTNIKTAARWENLKSQTLNKIMALEGTKLQAGDLFDSHSVDSATFVQGYLIAKQCEALLSGNHDISNNTEKSSAMDLLRQFNVNVVWEKPMMVDLGDTRFVMIPHQLTQEKFDTLLASAKVMIAEGRKNVLILHCNYGLREGSETENYLRPEVAKELLSTQGKDFALKHFYHIVCGHEHNSSHPLVGVTMMGSVLPMDFGQMTDKYVWTEASQILTWSAKENYRKLDYMEFLDLGIDEPLQFIEITGTVVVAEAIMISKRIVEWYKQSSTLIAIKNNTLAHKVEASETEDKASNPDNWISIVSAEMTEEEQVVFNELLGESHAH